MLAHAWSRKREKSYIGGWHGCVFGNSGSGKSTILEEIAMWQKNEESDPCLYPHREEYGKIVLYAQTAVEANPSETLAEFAIRALGEVPVLE